MSPSGPVPNPRVVYARAPSGLPIPGETTIYDPTPTIDINHASLNGGILVKTLVLSPDPYMRKRMRPTDVNTYFPVFEPGQIIAGSGVGVVVRSEMDEYAAGDYVYIDRTMKWQHYSTYPPTDPIDKIRNDYGLPLSTFVGVNGVPGQSAYHALKAFGNAKKGETIYVSTGAGAVGSVVCQLAKLWGLKVIASAGTDEKVRYLKDELKVDVAFNYKTVPVEEVLAEHPLDIYWDNVGGRVLETAIDAARPGARIIMCGYISEYSSQPRYGIKNMDLAIWKCLSFHGFLAWPMHKANPDAFFDEMPRLVAEGKIKYREQVTRGLENADRALREIFTGENFGKAVVIVADQQV
ncbi:hypothetical protein BOTBODRAFT_56796 [Botryobasidium botryosum FD-172 SS1]|uniref:Enoyl reductase (ER) domain-containing protein n=1 Tax=Botryobasidium botryosum (strain FD-172 SS1) TaxID=930990 RepID=A0A067M9S9_BOTB1|nr:hypothetical protein BOTBODRAFT_56796 [Botryobasidium botryosum FD-172 SS1]